jgi:hypothetical protein
MWSKDLARLKYFDPNIFLGATDSEKRVCGFALALALYANDAKVLLGLTTNMVEKAPDFKNICEEFGEYSGQRNYLHRLVYAHLHELHYIFAQYHNSVYKLPLFLSVLEAMTTGSRKSWDELVRMSLDKNDPMKSWLKNVRDGLGFHYVRHSQLLDGYKKWVAELKPGGKASTQEGAYISPGKSVKTTRYYFADAAIAAWLDEEIKTFPGPIKSLETLMERNVIAIFGFINSFIITRGGKLHLSGNPSIK